MKKFIIACVMGLMCATSMNAQGIFKKMGNLAKGALTNTVANNTKTKAVVDTLVLIEGTNKYMATNVTVYFIPQSGAMKIQTNWEEIPFHQYMNAMVKKDGDDIKLYRKDDVFVHIFKKDGVTYGLINNEGIIE